MERPSSESTNTHAWTGDEWEFRSVNVVGLGNWEIVPLACANLVIMAAPPAASIDFRSNEDCMAQTLTDDERNAEDAEDLADGLATLRKYESDGVGSFVKYSDYSTERGMGS